MSGHRHRPSRRQDATRTASTTVASVVLVLVVVLAVVLATTGGSARQGHRIASGGSSSGTPPSSALTTTTTTPPTTTTVDPGTLPQTRVLPTATDPQFQVGVGDLWQAVVTGDPATAMPFFFPLSAYAQVKGINDPAHDWQTRLVADFDQDITTLHADLGASAGTARFTSVSVPEGAAEWILPGVEDNKGSYYRVSTAPGSTSRSPGGRRRSPSPR